MLAWFRAVRISREWLLGALAFAIGVAFWPGTPGASISPRWALIGVGVWLFVKPVLLTTQHVVILLLLTWSALTLTWSQFGYDGIDAWLRLFFLCGAFWMGSSVESLRPVYIGFACALGVSSVIVIAQWYGWQGIQQAVSPAGLFMNKNTVAEIAALVLVGLIAERLWFYVPLVLPSFVIPQSRGALLAAGIACGIYFWTVKRNSSAAKDEESATPKRDLHWASVSPYRDP